VFIKSWDTYVLVIFYQTWGKQKYIGAEILKFMGICEKSQLKKPVVGALQLRNRPCFAFSDARIKITMQCPEASSEFYLSNYEKNKNQVLV
jgi:hypothetical protein